MSAELVPGDIVGPGDRLIMVVGNYGSGKTEVCVNLALLLAETGCRVQIADLDLVNPYFRCREVRQLMHEHGIRVVVPPGAQAWADLPIVLPEIRGMLHPPDNVVSIFDVGGDDVGARALASFRTDLSDGEYELWQVINSRRPFTRSVDDCLEMRWALEKASRFKVTGLLANSHLIDETSAETILEGWQLTRAISRRSGLPIRFVTVMESLAAAPELGQIDVPRLELRRHMLPPWRLPEPETIPAGRPVPLGKRTATETDGGRDGQNRR